VLAVATGSFALLQSLIIPVLSTIRTELDTSQNTATWVVTANVLSAAIFTPIPGRWRVGPRTGRTGYAAAERSASSPSSTGLSSGSVSTAWRSARCCSRAAVSALP
jgi:hypothetical protein